MEKKNNKLPETLNEWVLTLLLIALVLSIGLFAVNQYLAYRYKAVFLSTPCDLCLELNDNVKLCPSNLQLADLEKQKKEIREEKGFNLSFFVAPPE